MANRSRKVGMVKVTSCQADSLLALWILMMCSMSSWAKEPSSNSQPKKEFEWSSKPICVSPFRRSALKNICWLGYTQVSSVPACKWKSSTNRQSAKFYLWYRRFLALNGQREGLIWSWSLKKTQLMKTDGLYAMNWFTCLGSRGIMLRGSRATDELEEGLGEASWNVNLRIYSFCFGDTKLFSTWMGHSDACTVIWAPILAPTGSLKYFLFTFSHNHLWCYPPLQKVFLLLSHRVTTS